MSFEEWLQSRLTAHGFPVPVDGIVGPLTTEAIKAFEAKHGLPVNGTADEKVVALLRTSATATETTATPIKERDTELPESANPVAIKNTWPRQSGVPAFYGAVGTNQVRLELPFPMRIAWNKSQVIRSFSVHRKVAESAGRVFANIARTYSDAERKSIGIDLFGGALNVRKMRGGSNYSMHSWGIAIDFDPERNSLHWNKSKARLAHPDANAFWKAWEDEGWLSLGRARDFDWMHVQAARL